jgi:hypothetical protein
VRKSPLLFGGPRKTLKTTLIIDLVISLASGRAFLGVERFNVCRPVTVAVLSGESGEAVLQETAKRVCSAKGVDLAALPIYWGFTLPQLASPADVAALAAGLKEKQIKVLVIDPAYLCLLAGVEGKEINAANLFQVGPLLLSVGKACLDAGATPVLIHHSRKNLQAPYEPLELEDLAFAGFQEWARQWVLVNRRERFEPGSGTHRLWLTVGGSAGQGGEWAVDVRESDGDASDGTRTWEVTLEGARESRESAAEQRKSRQLKDDESKVLAAFQKLLEKATGNSMYKRLMGRADEAAEVNTAVPFEKVRRGCGLSGARATAAISRLEDDGVIEIVTLPRPEGGRGNPPRGIRWSEQK